MGGKQNGDYYNENGRPICDWGGKKMATEVGKEFTWQDVALRRIEHYKAVDTSSTILIPGYKFTYYRATVSQRLSTKCKFCIRVSGSPTRYNALLIF
jgi:hypothetical protein